MIFTSQSPSIYRLPFQLMASGLGGQCGRITSFGKALGPMLQQINAGYEASEGKVFPPRTLHDLLFNFSLNCLSLLQQQDGPELEHDELSFSYLPVAHIVLFCKNAPPMSKIILDRQPDCSKSASNGHEFPKLLPLELRSR
jgi:hypothetical protein